MIERLNTTLALGLVLVSIAGCTENEPPPPSPAPPALAPPGPAAPGAAPPVKWEPSGDPKTARFLGLAAPKPPTWIEHPPLIKMRTAEYTVPGRDGHNAAHVVVYSFGPTGGGTVEANIERWRTQFEPDADGLFPEPIVTTFETDGMPVTIVELAGSWRRMGAAWYTPDQVVINAIVEAPVGLVFVQFSGDAATVEPNRDLFLEMIEGLHNE